MAIPAMDSDWAVLAKLFLSLVHLAYEVNKTVSRLGNALQKNIAT